MAKNSRYGPAILRVFLGLLFIVPGITKLMNPAGIIGLVGKIGFPIAPLFGWIVIISELVCGAALIAGYKLKYAVWPLVVIMGVAAVAVYLPSIKQNPTTFLFHLVAIAGLVNLFLTGPGAYAAGKD
ncbi:DoxX family protein [Candidatus Woesearchaeota archaeon]|nr:DoxX family protein [Candidatus Woesearchaeota archaeon]